MSRQAVAVGLAPIAFRAEVAKIALDALEARFHGPEASLNPFETGPRLAAKLIEFEPMLRGVAAKHIELATMLGRFLSVLGDADGQNVEHA